MFEDHETGSLKLEGPGLSLLAFIYRAGDLATAYKGATMPTHWTQLHLINQDLTNLPKQPMATTFHDQVT